MRDAVNVLLRAAGQRVPLNPLMERLYRRFVPALGLIPGPSIVSIPGGLRFRVFDTPPPTLLNNPDFYIYYFGVWESRATRVLRRIIRPGDVCFDVGANLGWYTLVLGRLAGPAGAVHAFEPDPRAFARLQDNLALNPELQNVYLNALALGRARGTVPLFSVDETLYSSTFPIHRRPKAVFNVSTEPLDGYVDKHPISRIDFLKCDVEGSELAVFEGADGFLRDTSVPPIIQLEVNPATARAAGYTTDEMLAWLQARRGYTFYHITVTGRLVPASSPQEAAARLEDIFCLVPRLHEDRLRRVQPPSGPRTADDGQSRPEPP
jgi:FkbM family methyltransferase